MLLEQSLVDDIGLIIQTMLHCACIGLLACLLGGLLMLFG